MNKIVNLSQQERNELFSETASSMNTTKAIVENQKFLI